MRMVAVRLHRFLIESHPREVHTICRQRNADCVWIFASDLFHRCWHSARHNFTQAPISMGWFVLRMKNVENNYWKVQFYFYLWISDCKIIKKSMKFARLKYFLRFLNVQWNSHETMLEFFAQIFTIFSCPIFEWAFLESTTTLKRSREWLSLWAAFMHSNRLNKSN